MKLTSFAIETVTRFPKESIFSFVLMIIQGVFSAIAIISIAPVIDLVLHPDRASVSPLTEKMMGVTESLGFPPTLLFFSLVFLFMMAAKNLVLVLISYGLLVVKFVFLRELTAKSLESFFQSQWSFFANRSHGKFTNTFLKEIFRSGDGFGQMAMLFAQFNQAVIYSVVPFIISWQLTLICMTAVFLFASPLWLLGKLSYRFGMKRTRADNELTGILKEGIDGAKVVMGFGKQRHFVGRYFDAFNALRRAAIAVSVLDNGIRRLYEPLGIAALLIAIYVTSRRSFPIAETGVVLFALRGVIQSLGEVVATRSVLVSFLPSVEQVEQLRNEAVNLRSPSGKLLFEKLKVGIKLKDVSFSHGAGIPTIRNLNLDIPNGKLVGIVGKSGSGKSTLIDMLLGLIVVDHGYIEVDGIPLNRYDLESYRKRIGYVPQDPVLFNMSIRDNLLWANPNATEEELWECCVVANAAEFIRNLPLELDTQIGDRGIRLSGGQQQRLALARALIRNPTLLLLDEATSALDTASERLIQDAIEKTVGYRTIVVVAHRLSTITGADFIYVFDQGRILEAGTYGELLMMKGLFSKMVKAQKLKEYAEGVLT